MVMPAIIRFGLLVLSLVGACVGASIFFQGDLLFALCGKSCGFNRALVALVGPGFAEFILSVIWFLGAAVAGILAICRSKD